MEKEYTYKYEITLHNKEDVETLFSVVEKMGDGSHGSIRPLDEASFEITTNIMDVIDNE